MSKDEYEIMREMAERVCNDDNFDSQDIQILFRVRVSWFWNNFGSNFSDKKECTEAIKRMKGILYCLNVSGMVPVQTTVDFIHNQEDTNEIFTVTYVRKQEECRKDLLQLIYSICETVNFPSNKIFFSRYV